MKSLLKYIGVLALLAICWTYIPYGWLITYGVILISLWNLVNNK